MPKNRRCLDLGHALHHAIKSFDGFGRVAVMASGGLTHFVIDEDLDRKILAAMKSGDEAALEAIPESLFKVGHGGDQELVSGDFGDERDATSATIWWTTCHATGRKREPETRWRSCTGIKL